MCSLLHARYYIQLAAIPVCICLSLLPSVVWQGESTPKQVVLCTQTHKHTATIPLCCTCFNSLLPVTLRFTAAHVQSQWKTLYPSSVEINTTDIQQFHCKARSFPHSLLCVYVPCAFRNGRGSYAYMVQLESRSHGTKCWCKPSEIDIIKTCVRIC